MLKSASNPIDVQDFQFKLQCRLQIFDNTEGNPIKNVSNLIASASRFGLLFAGCNSPQLKVIRFASIEDYSSSNSIANYSRREVILPSVPQHINVNCDHTILSVIVERDNCPVVLFYDVKSFLSQNIVTLSEIRLSTTQGVKILAASWHPTVATIFTDCETDGTLGVYELKGKSVDINKLPAESKATCFCWSPKGKQIAVGSKNGKLIHYKPDLKAVKVINAPPFEKPNSMISVQWISTFQFIGIFKSSDDSEEQCSIVSIDAPKTGNPTFTNFYDICYSNGSFRSPQFYMIFEQHWNILIVASSNSIEVGVLALMGDSWVQWTLSDSARAELPLDENREETYPVGIAIDTSSVKPVPWGESSLQPAPSLLLLSHQGILCSFKIINLKEGAPGINSPPENLNDLSGSGAFTTGRVTVSKSTSDNSNVHHSTQPSLMQNIPQQTSSKQIQKETNPIQNTFKMNPIAQNDVKSMQIPQTNLRTQLVETQPTQKALLSNEPQAINNFAKTNLFGGQVTITPTNTKGPTTKITSAKGSMVPTNMGTGIPNSVISDAASSSTLIAPKLSNQQIITTRTGAPQTQQKIVVPASVPQVLTENVPSSVMNQSATQQENSEEIEKILAQMIQMECSALEKELKIILYQGKNIRINLDPQSMDTIVNQTKDIDDFIVELIGTSESQSSEIHVLKQNTVQSWAWLEEAKSRLREYQNEELSALLKSKPLDSVSEKHLHTLKQMEYYLESQLSQAHKALDEQWDKFQEYCRKINRVQLPTMEAIFQTMVKQNAILQKHDFILKDITSQMKGKKRISKHISLFNNLNKNESLEDSFHNLKLEPEDICQIYYKKIMNRVKPMPQNKSKQLRRILQNRDVPHVKVNSQVAKSVLQRTPEKRNTSIFVHMTPTAKQHEVVAKAINFYQSTPLNVESINSATQIPSSALSAFACTNIGKSSSASISNSGIRTGIENIYNAKPDKFSDAAFIKLPEKEANTLSASNIPFNITPKTTREDEESKNILKGQSGTGNLGQSASTSTSLLSFMLKPKTTISQSNQKLLFMPTKSTSSSVNVIEKLENPVSSGPSNIKIEQNSTSNSTSHGIFPSAFTKLGTSISTQSDTSLPVSSNLAKSTGLFGKSLNSSSLFTMKSTDKSTEQIISSTSTNPNSSFSINTVSTATSTKPSFFTPITSGHLNIPITDASQQLPIVNPSSSKPSAFTPLISSQPPINSPSIPSLTSITTSPSIFGKPSTVLSNMLSTSSSSSQPLSFSITPQNIISTQSKSLSTLNEPATGISSEASIFGKAVTTMNQSGSISSPSTNSSSGFSFLTGIQTTVSSTAAPMQSNLFNTRAQTSTEFSPDQNTQVPATTQSLFSNSLGTSASAAGIFGPTTTTAPQISGSADSIIFGPTSTTTAHKVDSIPSSSNIFGSTTTITPQIIGSTANIGSSVFGSIATTNPGIFDSKTTIASQMFGTTATLGSSIFSPSTTTTPIIASTGSSIFGNTTTTTSSMCSRSVSSSKSTESTFGPNTTFAPSSTSSLFSSTSSSVFGGSAPGVTSASSGSLFDNTSVANNESIFNTAVTGNKPTFGSDMAFTASSSFSTASTSATPIFGNTTVSTAPFAKTVSANFGLVTSTTSPFNVSTTTSTPSFGGSVSFGAPSTTASPSFGASAFVGNNVSTSPFGVVSSSAPMFGSATTSSSSMFGNVTSAATSPFGIGTLTSSATPFDATSSSTNPPFGKPSVFGQPSAFSSGGFNTTQTTSPSIFGQNKSGVSSVFGNSATLNNFGGTTTSSTFGTSAPPFGTISPAGGTSLFEQTNSSLFGPPKNIFGGSANTENLQGSFGFGNLNVGAPTQNPEQTETKSPFGGGNFSDAAASGSIFGSSSFGGTSGGSIFGQPTFGNSSNFGNTAQQAAGPFSGGSGSVSQAGFGTAPAFQKQAGFGVQSSFGGSPTFGAAPTFGGSPTFGSTSPFGSPNKVFGSAPPTGVFGTGNQQSSGFGNLANQNTIGFGSLAQSASNPGQNSNFSGSSSFSSWR